MAYQDLLDLDTLVAVKKAAPERTMVPFDAAQIVVGGLKALMVAETAMTDRFGQRFWISNVKEIVETVAPRAALSYISVGKALKMMGLETWREGDGSHVAFSEAQMKILKQHFKV